MLWREHEAEAARALCGKPLLGFLRHMRRMIVQDQLYRGIGRVGRIEPLEEADELARAVAVFDEACTCKVSRSIPASRLNVPCRLYS